MAKLKVVVVGASGRMAALVLPAFRERMPPQAARVERLRRELLDLYRSWGYELVIPPVVEYLESLLTGTGHDLDLQTFKLTDQLTGRLLGVRADMTPQVARIQSPSSTKPVSSVTSVNFPSPSLRIRLSGAKSFAR